MRAFALASLIGFASFAVMAGACSFKLGDDSEGDMGNLKFQYSNFQNCFLGCSLDKKTLQGAVVTVSVRGDSHTLRHGRMAMRDAVATVSSSNDECSCAKKTGDSTTSSRTIDPGKDCDEGESRTCSMTVDIECNGSGDDKLEIVDAKDNVIDRVDIHVRTASRIDIGVATGTGRTAVKADDNGVYQVKLNDTIAVNATVFSADDEELFFSHGGLTDKYLDDKIVRSTADYFASPTTETMSADHTGDTTVTVEAVGARSVVHLRVAN